MNCFFQLMFGFSTFLSILSLNFYFLFISDFGSLGLAQTYCIFLLPALPSVSSLCWQVRGWWVW